MSEPHRALTRTSSPTHTQGKSTRRDARVGALFVRDANIAVSLLLAVAEGGDDAVSLRYPAEAYTMLGALELLANRERRLLRELSLALAAMQRDAGIVIDVDADQPDPTHAVNDTLTAIATATELLLALEDALDQARQPIACAALRPNGSGRGASR